MRVKMHRNKISGCVVVFLSLFAVFRTADAAHGEFYSSFAFRQTAETRFKGRIAQSRFEMNLRRDGERLSGSYFYVKSGGANSLNLSGTIDKNGKFALRETDAAGKQTGEFTGVWKKDANDAGASLEGEWKKPKDKEAQSFMAREQMIYFAGAAQIAAVPINETVKAKRLEMSAVYPRLTGAANAAGFNRLVKTRVANEIAAFKKQMMTTSAEDLRMMPAGMNNYIDIGYDIEYADDDFISVNFVRSEFTGGAHPNYNFLTVNYDLKNNREIKLGELFKPGTKYLGTISAYATKDLQSRTFSDSGENLGLAQDVFADGALPKPENYARWSITKKGLLFTFDPYQVGPYAAGAQYVIVPYTALKSIARPDGALEKFIK
jgi:hypothetical protein